MNEEKNIQEPTKKAWSIGVVVARFLRWYKTDDSGMLPTPSNAQYFCMGVIAVTSIIIKVLQELDLIGV